MDLTHLRNSEFGSRWAYVGQYLD